MLVALGAWLYPNSWGHGGSCRVASAPALILRPNRGDINTEIAVSGVGFVPNGKVRLTFRDDYMGEATADCAGRFNITAPIPKQNVYIQPPNTQFYIRATGYTSSGDSNQRYVQATFLLTDPDTVIAYQTAYVRDSPYRSGTAVNHVEAGQIYPALCREEGEQITEGDITNDV